MSAEGEGAGMPCSAMTVVVIGGGHAGLATAALLARGGAKVRLLERHDAVGGRAGRWSAGGFTFDLGPSWYFMPEAFEHYFALLGRRVDDEVSLQLLDPAYRLFVEPDSAGDPRVPALELSADAEANWAVFEAVEPGAGERMRRYAEESSEAYRLALDHFLYTTFARPDRLLTRELLPRLGRLVSLLTESLAERIARTVEHPVLRQALGYHGVFLGSSPYRAPALYSLMSHLDLVDGVRYPRGGMYAVVEALERAARAEGVEIRTGVEVTGIDVSGGVATAVRTSDGQRIAADVVIAAADLHHVETELLDDEWRTHPEASWRRRTPGVSALLVYAGVRGELPELGHHTLLFSRDWPANFEAILGPGEHSVLPWGPTATPGFPGHAPHPASIYVCKSSATDPAVAPPGHENLMMLVPFPADPRVGSGEAGAAELDALADAYLDQVADWAGVPGLRERVIVRRVMGPADFAAQYSAWQGGALGLEHTLGQSAFLRPSNISSRVGNLLYAGGSTVPGVGVPMCLISAELVVKRLLGETSTRALPGPLRKGFLDAARPAGRQHWGGARG